MCGLAGVFLGTAKRSDADLRHLAGLFTRLLAVSEIRGTHAAGVALLGHSGPPRIFKRPVTASQFVRLSDYDEILRKISPSSTLLMGHARWATRGSVVDNSNNHPIRAGDVIGTHNGTITNADELFERFGLDRTAVVDSEVLVRMADRALCGSAIDDASLLASLAHCRGQMSAALASRLDPGRLLLFRGNNPLEARFDPRRRALIYASEGLFIDAALAGEPGWRVLPLPAMHYLDVRSEDPGDAIPRPFRFLAEGRETAPARTEPDSLIHRVLRERAWKTDVVRDKARPSDSSGPLEKKRRPSPKAESATRGTRSRKRKKGDTE